MIFKVNNLKESIVCQKMLFKMGYVWNYGHNVIYKYSAIHLICDEKLKVITYDNFNAKYENVIYFNVYFREKKLKRILDDI